MADFAASVRPTLPDWRGDAISSGFGIEDVIVACPCRDCARRDDAAKAIGDLAACPICNRL